MTFFRFIEVMELLFISGLMVQGAAGIAGFLPFWGNLSILAKFIAILFGSFWVPLDSWHMQYWEEAI